MPKIKKRIAEYYVFYCNGCEHEHTYTVFSDNSQWQFNGDMENPTFTPSLLNRNIDREGVELYRCHLFVTDGKIVYCSDCSHGLAGQTIELKNI